MPEHITEKCSSPATDLARGFCEVRINGVIHAKTTLRPDTTVPIDVCREEFSESPARMLADVRDDAGKASSPMRASYLGVTWTISWAITEPPCRWIPGPEDD